MCLPRFIHKTHISKLGAVQDSQSWDSVGGMAVYTQTITTEIIWGCNYQGWKKGCEAFGFSSADLQAMSRWVVRAQPLPAQALLRPG